MDLETARQILGVTAETPIDEIRRTYLRLVRRHGPESAPEEFQRIRAAYDCLRERKPPSGPAPDVSGPAPAPAGEAPRPAGWDASFEAVLEKLRTLSAFAADGRATVVERAYREHPDDARFVWLALEEMMPYSPVHGRLRALLRDAVDRGHLVALEPLTFLGPRLVRDDERAALLGAENPASQLLGARVLVAAGDRAGAAAVVERVLQRTTRVVPAGLIIDLGFAALAVNDAAAAARMRAALDAHFATYHDQASVMTPALAALWGVFVELLDLSRDFPASAIICISRVARGDSLEMPIEVGRTLLTLPGLPQDKKMVALLTARAPLVSQMVDLRTAFNTFGWHTTHNRWQDVVKAVAFLAVVFGGRALLCTGIERATDPSRALEGLSPPSDIASLVYDQVPRDLTLIEMPVCTLGSAPYNQAECTEMMAIMARLQSGVCDRKIAGLSLSLHDSPLMQRFRALAREPAQRNCATSAAAGGAR